MRRIIAICLVFVIITTGCASKQNGASVNSTTAESSSNDDTTDISEAATEESTQEVVFSDDISFDGLNNSELNQYLEDEIYAELEGALGSEDYVIDRVQAIYISKEYIEELSYNSQENIFFGYTLSELKGLFQDNKYVFTLAEDGTTTVTEFEDYDDTWDQVMKNVAIGTGVILICVTVSVLTAGTAPTVSIIFAASAKTGTAVALKAGFFGGMTQAAITGIQTGDLEEALKAGALGASEGFKWGAITGAAAGGIEQYIAIRNYIPTPRESELEVLRRLGGREQVSYLNGQEVLMSTPGATRPDILRQVGDGLEAVEVKNYNLASSQSRSTLYRELERQVTSRVQNLPSGTSQRVVLDIRGRNFSTELLDDVVQNIQNVCSNSYPNIPVDFLR